MFVSKLATLILCCSLLMVVLIFTNQFWSQKSFTFYGVRTAAHNEAQPQMPSLEEMATPSAHFGPSSGDKMSAKFINCRPMFDIGSGSNAEHGESSLGVAEPLVADLRTLKRKKERNTQLTDDYFSLVQALPDMVKRSGKLLTIQTETRLKQLNGHLPYIPCRVNLFEDEDIKQCTSSRRNSFHPIWVAYVGDSKMRYRFLYMADATDKVFNWSFTFLEKSGSKYTNIRLPELQEIISKNRCTTCEGIGANGERLTYICSRFGIPDVNLVQWANAPSSTIIPDVLSFEFGAWIAATTRLLNLQPQDKSLSAWFNIRPLLKRLAQRTLVLATAHSRLRTDPQVLHNLHQRFSSLSTFEYSYVDSEIEMMDMAMTAAIGGSNVVLWDSSLPLNLASRTDCQKIRDINQLSSQDQGKTNWNETTKFQCHDTIHRNDITMQDETTMILNYLCNRFVPRFSNNVSCCS